MTIARYTWNSAAEPSPRGEWVRYADHIAVLRAVVEPTFRQGWREACDTAEDAIMAHYPISASPEWQAGHDHAHKAIRALREATE